MMRGYGFYNGYGMMGGGWFGFVIMLALGLIVLAGIVLLVVWAMRAGSGHGHAAAGSATPPPSAPQPSHDEAIAIARRRFAAGEISKEQFDEMMKSLGS
jgi:putative membrane protein